MQTVDMDFLPARWWRWVWLAGLCIGVAMAVYAWHFGARVDGELQRMRSEASQARSELQRQALVQAGAPDLRERSTHTIVRTLQRDWNIPFTTIEGLATEGARLKTFHVDGAAGVIQLEYEFGTAETALALTEQLNAGRDVPLWKFEEFQSQAHRGQRDVLVAAPAPFAGRWSAHLE